MKKIELIKEIIMMQKELVSKGKFNYLATMHDLCDMTKNELNYVYSITKQIYLYG